MSLALERPTLFGTAGDLARCLVVPALSRLVVKKPIGSDLARFQGIDGLFRSWRDEFRIYRMDHYLGKETAQNMLALRFANPLFERRTGKRLPESQQ